MEKENKDGFWSWFSGKKIFETLLTGFLVAALSWAWNLETRLARLEEKQNVVQRVENLENLLQPVLIEYRMSEELKKLGINPHVINQEGAAIPINNNFKNKNSDDMGLILNLLKSIQESQIMQMNENTEEDLEMPTSEAEYYHIEDYEKIPIALERSAPPENSLDNIKFLEKKVKDSVNKDINRYNEEEK